MKTMLRNLLLRVEEILFDLGLTIRVVLHPRATRRRLREAQRRLHRRSLANQVLATRNLEMAAAAVTAAKTLDEATELIGELSARVVELEQALVAQSGKGLDDVWADAAGVAGPETRQP